MDKRQPSTMAVLYKILKLQSVPVAPGPTSLRIKNRHLHEQKLADACIIGGSEADEDRFSYAVYLGGCGRSLIAKDVVLTAEHCGSPLLLCDIGAAHSQRQRWRGDPRPGSVAPS